MNDHRDARLLLGWNVGGTTCSAVVGTAGGTILEKREWASNPVRGPQAMIEDFLKQAASLREHHPRMCRAGVSIGGPMDPRKGIIQSPPHLPGWHELPLQYILSDALKLPVRVEHDAAACLAAECLWGEAVGLTHVVYLTAGTGFGAAIMIGRNIVRGPAGQTTEIGHIRLADHGPLLYGKEGCAESFCSGTGIGLLASHLYPELFPEPVSPRRLAESCERESCREAREVLRIAARWTGRVCGMLADLFSPQMIIAGSMARYLPPWWMEEIRQEMHREALPRNTAHTQIVAPFLADSLQDLSAIVPCLFEVDGPLPPAVAARGT